MALFKVCSRTVTQRIVTQHVVAPAFLTIRRNFGVKDTLDKYRDGGTAKFEDGMDTIEKETDKLMKQKPRNSFDLPENDLPKVEKAEAEKLYKKFKKRGDSSFQIPTPNWLTKDGHIDEGLKKELLKQGVIKEGDDMVEAAQQIAGVLEERKKGKRIEKEEHSIYFPEGMNTNPDMTKDEAEKIAEEVYRSWPKDNSLPIDDVLPFAEKMKAADLDGSYGPQKAEFDTWKRIYKEEEQFERLGLPPRAHYWRDGEMYAPYGTLSNPVKIYSQFSHRIVGCHGGNGQPHEIAWINLGNKYKTMCPECGQMFMLVNYFPKEHEEPGEDLHDISITQNDGHLKEPQLY